MIYNDIKVQKFDDSTIRAVDKIVDTTFYRENSYMIYLNRDQYLNEYRKVFINLPRQVGKTTYLNKLYHKFISMGYSTIIITHDYITKKHYYSNIEDVFSISQIENYRYKVYEKDIILYDEINSENAKFLGSKYTLGLYTR